MHDSTELANFLSRVFEWATVDSPQAPSFFDLLRCCFLWHNRQTYFFLFFQRFFTGQALIPPQNRFFRSWGLRRGAEIRGTMEEEWRNAMIKRLTFNWIFQIINHEGGGLDYLWAFILGAATGASCMFKIAAIRNRSPHWNKRNGIPPLRRTNWRNLQIVLAKPFFEWRRSLSQVHLVEKKPFAIFLINGPPLSPT